MEEKSNNTDFTATITFLPSRCFTVDESRFLLSGDAKIVETTSLNESNHVLADHNEQRVESIGQEDHNEQRVESIGQETEIPTSSYCCICYEVPKVKCYPKGCSDSHVMCYPYCVSKYTYMQRIDAHDIENHENTETSENRQTDENSSLKCPYCRHGFSEIIVENIYCKSELVRVTPNSLNHQNYQDNESIQSIPDFPSLIATELPVPIRNQGCLSCWGIYYPMESTAFSISCTSTTSYTTSVSGTREEIFHQKKRGHRGRHRTMPFSYRR